MLTSLRFSPPFPTILASPLGIGRGLSCFLGCFVDVVAFEAELEALTTGGTLKTLSS
jgi:hypothetical protein